MRMERPSSRPRPSRREGGFSLLEVLLALLIVGTTLAALQYQSTESMDAAIEASKLRVAKMLLRQKAEEVAAGIEPGTVGTFDGYQGYEWEVTETEVPVTAATDAAAATGTGAGTAAAAAAQPESVRSVTVAVKIVDQAARDDMSRDYGEGEDRMGVVRVTILLDPTNAELQPPGGQQGTGQPVGGGPPK